jgi:hypothetical protein
MANFFESITIFSLDYNRKINTSNKNNIVPRDRRTGPVGFKSWIDAHRGIQKLEEMFRRSTVFVLTIE